MSSCQYGTVHPPCSNPPSRSSSLPPGAWIHAVQRHEFGHDELCHNTSRRARISLVRLPSSVCLSNGRTRNRHGGSQARAVRQLAEWSPSNGISAGPRRSWKQELPEPVGEVPEQHRGKAGPIGRSLVFWNAASFHWPSCRRATTDSLRRARTAASSFSEAGIDSVNGLEAHATILSGHFPPDPSDQRVNRGNPRAFIEQRRIEHARALIEDTDQPLAEIAPPLVSRRRAISRRPSDERPDSRGPLIGGADEAPNDVWLEIDFAHIAFEQAPLKR